MIFVIITIKAIKLDIKTLYWRWNFSPALKVPQEKTFRSQISEVWHNNKILEDIFMTVQASYSSNFVKYVIVEPLRLI